MSKISFTEVSARGEYEETIVRDMTSVEHPVAAKIFRRGSTYLIVPDSDVFPVVLRDSLNAALSFVERIVSE